MLSQLIKSRAQAAAENILTKSIRAITPSSSSASIPPPLLAATKKWPTPKGPHGVVVVHDENPCELAQHLLNGYKDFFESEAGKQYNGTLTKFSGQKFLEVVAEPDGDEGENNSNNKNNNTINETSSSSSSLGIASQVCPGGCVVLIQNHAFQNQTHTYRLRLPLMEMGLRVVEHPHLVYATTPIHVAFPSSSTTTASAAAERISSSENFEIPMEKIHFNYVESCCIDPEECDKEAKSIGKLLDEASSTSIFCKKLSNDESTEKELKFSGALEKCLYNTGKFWNEEAIECGMKGQPHKTSSDNNSINPSRPVGGSFPFGEVISESILLSGLNGECNLFAFPNIRRTMSRAAYPFGIKIEHGAIVDIASDAPQDFIDLCNMVRDAEGEVIVRELGIGLNRALGAGDKMLGDVTSFERQWGVHLSLGKRHPLFVKKPEKVKESAKLIYKKEGEDIDQYLKPYDLLKRRNGKFHLDVFLDVDRIVTTNNNNNKEQGGIIKF